MSYKSDLRTHLAEQIWRNVAAILHGRGQTLGLSFTAVQATIEEALEQFLEANIQAITEERDAGWRRAEAAESDWQAAERALDMMRIAMKNSPESPILDNPGQNQDHK